MVSWVTLKAFALEAILQPDCELPTGNHPWSVMRLWLNRCDSSPHIWNVVLRDATSSPDSDLELIDSCWLKDSTAW